MSKRFHIFTLQGLLFYAHFFTPILCTIDNSSQQATYTDKKAITFVVKPSMDDLSITLNAFIKEPFYLSKLTCDSDVLISAFEFTYLTGLKDGAVIQLDEMEKALFCLQQKQLFETITVTLTPINNGYNMHFDLVGYWTLKKVKIHGMFIGKDVYRNYYLMDAGDRFEPAKHHHSLEKIQEVLRQEGYFGANITNTLDYNKEIKQVTVNLTIRRGPIFTIHTISVELLKDQGVELNPDEMLTLQKEIEKTLTRRLKDSSYNKDLITTQIKAIKHMLEKKGFLDLSIEMKEKNNKDRSTVDLQFTINLHHKKQFSFSGNHFFSHDDLLEIILLFGKSAWMLPSSIIADELQAVYRDKGFWKSTISSHENNNISYFDISEGPRISISKVTVKNAPYFNQNATKAIFKKVIKSKFYDAQLIKESLHMLVSWYYDEGFLDAKIIKHECIPLDENNHLLVITMDEGIRWFLETVHVDPYKELESQIPFSSHKEPIIFNQKIVLEQRKWLIEYFHKQGYSHVEIKPEIERSNGKITITWKIIVSATKVHFGKTIVIGSGTFPLEYVLRELQYKQGDIWDKDILKSSFLKLKELQLFEDIHIYPYQGTSDEQEKPIILKLTPDDPYEIRVRAGLELQNFTQQYILSGLTYRAGGAFIIKSPLNQGDQLRFDADFAAGHREIVAKYTIPWIFNMPIKTIFMGYSNAYDQPGFIGSPGCNLYQVVQQGVLLGLSRHYHFIDFGLNLGFEWLTTKRPDKSVQACALINNIARAINFDPRLLDQNMPFLNVEPTIILDFLDQKLNPTKGSFTLLSLKGFFPLRKPNLNTFIVKAMVEESFFIPIKSTVAAFRIKFGHIFNRAFNAIMPNERFYLGGANSLRGYESDFAGPLGKYCGCNNKDTFVPQGGRSMINVNAELRFPIYKSIGGVVFQDLGALSSTMFTDFKPADILASTGCGLRVATPLGSLRFDIGWKWARHTPSDRSFAWFLTFGQAF